MSRMARPGWLAWGRAALWAAAAGVLAPGAAGRIGEAVDELEKRLLGEGRSLRMMGDERERQVMDAPFARHLHRFPEEHEIRVYYKRDDGERALVTEARESAQPRGWVLLVVFVEGRSVLEVYRRNGPGPSEPELRLLLVAQQGDSHWARLERGMTAGSGGGSLFGYEYERADGAVRAHRDRNFVYFFSVNFDRMLAAQVEAERAEQQKEIEKTAPVSVRGF